VCGVFFFSFASWTSQTHYTTPHWFGFPYFSTLPLLPLYSPTPEDQAHTTFLGFFLRNLPLLLIHTGFGNRNVLGSLAVVGGIFLKIARLLCIQLRHGSVSPTVFLVFSTPLCIFFSCSPAATMVVFSWGGAFFYFFFPFVSLSRGNLKQILSISLWPLSRSFFLARLVLPRVGVPRFFTILSFGRGISFYLYYRSLSFSCTLSNGAHRKLSILFPRNFFFFPLLRSPPSMEDETFFLAGHIFYLSLPLRLIGFGIPLIPLQDVTTRPTSDPI